MKVLQINTVYKKGSTGNIAYEIQQLCKKQGIENIVGYRYREGDAAYEDTIEISGWWDCHFHNRMARIIGATGMFSYFKTLGFLRKVKKYYPDIIHLHNLHGNYINLPLLLKFIKKHKIKVVWTLHDCWAFTGGCAYFSLSKCKNWLTDCDNCPLKKKLVSQKAMHKRKKKLFMGIERVELVGPSKWTADLAKRSFLGEYPVRVIYNAIDLSVFKPTNSDFIKQHKLEGKKLMLGVAFDWGYRKGLDVFCKLSEALGNEYRIILVGTNDDIDKTLPEGIISIHRTENQTELAKIYTAADVFVNPTREEAFGLVNIEALACGTPVVTFNTDGSPECIDESCGSVVECDDVATMISEIKRICEDKPYSAKACIKRAQYFDKNTKFNEYVELYKEIMR